MKRIISMVLAVSLMFSLSACNLDNPDVGTRNVNDQEMLDFNEQENNRARDAQNDLRNDLRDRRGDDHPLNVDPDLDELDRRMMDQDGDGRFNDDVLNRNNK